MCYSRLGDQANTLLALRKAVEQRCFPMIVVAVDPSFEFVRTDPEFGEIRRLVGL